MRPVDVKKLLDPTGPQVQKIVHGTRIAGRVAVTVYWDGIEDGLRSGLSVTAIYCLFREAGLVSVTLQAFTRQVKARRERARGSETAAKPAAEPLPVAESAVSADEAKPDASAQAAMDKPKPPETKPGIPHRPWRTGPYEPPDPNAVFKPRDPLADDD